MKHRESFEVEHMPMNLRAKNRPIHDLTAHIFRHNYATMLYYSGISLKKAAALMGHADTKMIMEVYSHLNEQKEQTETKLNSFIKMGWFQPIFLTTIWLPYIKKSASDYQRNTPLHTKTTYNKNLPNTHFTSIWEVFPVMRHRGIEPRTTWLKVKCSTDWASIPYSIRSSFPFVLLTGLVGFEPTRCRSQSPVPYRLAIALGLCLAINLLS